MYTSYGKRVSSSPFPCAFLSHVFAAIWQIPSDGSHRLQSNPPKTRFFNFSSLGWGLNPKPLVLSLLPCHLSHTHLNPNWSLSTVQNILDVVVSHRGCCKVTDRMKHCKRTSIYQHMAQIIPKNGLLVKLINVNIILNWLCAIMWACHLLLCVLCILF